MSNRSNTKKASRFSGEDVIPLTPMIDVVFQLLVYFVFTFEAIDVFTHIPVYNPTMLKDGSSVKKEYVNINIYSDGRFGLNGRSLSREDFGDMLGTLGELNPSQTVIINISSESKHQHLIEVLDHCAEAKMANLSVVTRG